MNINEIYEWTFHEDYQATSKGTINIDKLGLERKKSDNLLHKSRRAGNATQFRISRKQ